MLTRQQSWYFVDVLPIGGRTSFGDPEATIAALGFVSVRDFQLSFAHFDLRTDGSVDRDTERAVNLIASNGGKLSPHFSIAEFRSKATGQVLVHRALLRALEALRESIGRSVSITHGFRTIADEERLKAAKLNPATLSQHKFGMAADIGRVDFVSVRKLGMFSGIGCVGEVGGPVIHVDVRHAGARNFTSSTTAKPVIWVYG